MEMILKNITKGTLLAKDLKKVKSIEDQILGLLKKSNPRSLLFKTNLGIHTFGMSAPIDIIILDKNFKVVKIKQNLNPNKLFFWNLKYSLVLELPNRTIEKTKTVLFDQLKII